MRVSMLAPVGLAAAVLLVCESSQQVRNHLQLVCGEGLGHPYVEKIAVPAVLHTRMIYVPSECVDETCSMYIGRTVELVGNTSGDLECGITSKLREHMREDFVPADYIYHGLAKPDRLRRFLIGERGIPDDRIRFSPGIVANAMCLFDRIRLKFWKQNLGDYCNGLNWGITDVLEGKVYPDKDPILEDLKARDLDVGDLYPRPSSGNQSFPCCIRLYPGLLEIINRDYVAFVSEPRSDRGSDARDTSPADLPLGYTVLYQPILLLRCVILFFAGVLAVWRGMDKGPFPLGLAGFALIFYAATQFLRY